MRPGQLAREYNVPLQDILSYLNELEPSKDKFHVNTKLDEPTKALVARRFESLVEVAPEGIEVQSEEQPAELEQHVVEPELIAIEETVEVPHSEPELPVPEMEVKEQQNVNEESIETDRLLELLESEETPIDLSKITHIKAPKKELSGLKVVGKIELAEPKSKPAESSEQQEEESGADRISRQERRQLSQEEREQKRIRIKKNREEYEARLEKRREEKEKKARKTQKKAHYERKLQGVKPKQQRQKLQKQSIVKKAEVQLPKNQSILGRFWRWLNT